MKRIKVRSSRIITLSLLGLSLAGLSLMHDSDIGAFEVQATAPTLGNYSNVTVQLSGDTTNTPSAAPTNTTRMTVSTSTDFKGRLEGDPTTGVVRVTDAHPAGTYTVTVTAFDSAGATTTKTFTLTVATPVTCNPVTFAAATNFHAAGWSVAVGDFNGDGKQDIAAVGGNTLAILLGDGAGGFGTATNFPVGSLAVSLAVGDFNGDGKQDIVVVNQTSNTVSVLLGDGAGGFGAATNFNVGSSPNYVAVGDFNGDGKLDVAVVNLLSDTVSVLLGDGAGSLGTATNFNVGSHPIAVAVGDFNGNGNQDLAVANFGTNIGSDDGNVSILLGNGAGSFGAATNFHVATPRSVAVGDFNGDGAQDVVTASDNNAVSVLLGNGAGSFGTFTQFPAGGTPDGVAVGDFNGDGIQDLAVADFGSVDVSVLLGDGAGSFGAATFFAAEFRCTSVAVGDFNGDGKQDLAVANRDVEDVSILIRQCPETACTITCPQNQTVNTGPGATQCCAVVNYPAPTTTGSCGTVTCSQASGSCFPVGATTVTCKSNNGAGPEICTFTVTVTDNTPPAITCPANITTSTSASCAVVNYNNPTVGDNCPGVGTPTCNPSSGTCFPQGTTTVTCSVKDASNNMASCSFTVTVTGSQPLSITCPSNISAVASASSSACPYPTSAPVNFTVTTSGVGVTFVCKNQNNQVVTSGSAFPVGTTTVMCTATDASGNTANCGFTVSVFSFCLQDETNPGNVVLVNAQTGDFSYCCGGVTIASGRGTLTTRGCIGSIDHTKGNRQVHIQWDTAAVNGAGAGTAYVQKLSDKIVCQITDKNMSNNTCQCSAAPPPVSPKKPSERAF